MQYLTVKNLSKTYIGPPLFDSIDFSVSKGEKIALVAKNGAGKSTLLKVLSWEEEAEGRVEFSKSIKVWFLSQTMNLGEDMIVRDALYNADNPIAQTIKLYEQIIKESEPDADKLDKILSDMEEQNARDYENRIKITISQLKLEELLEQTIHSLSGGELKRVMLAKILIDEPDFLILDEPTNHLDLDMIERLENYLWKSNITLLMVTHDRYFLERVCDHIIELDRGNVYRYDGNYSYFLEKKAEREDMEAIEFKKLKNYYRRELERMRRGPSGRGTKLLDREKKFAKLETKLTKQKKNQQEQAVKLDIQMEERRLGNKILKIKNLKKAYGDKTILENFSHEFRYKERVGIIGKNGVGKSTLLNIIMEKEPYDSGSIRTGETIKFGYYAQDEIQFEERKRIIDVVEDVAMFITVKWPKWKTDKISAKKMLEQFLFPASMQYQRADTLSGGEKRRLYLLTILMTSPNFLILDEPTNDLDLITLSVLEDFLTSYQGCLIVVSHDRFFMDRLMDHLFVFEWDGIIQDFWWSYTEYRAEVNIEKREKWKEKSEKRESEKSSSVKRKLSYMEKREIRDLEKALKKLEKRKEEINALFYDSSIPQEEITKLSEELGEIIRNIDVKEERWLELSD